MNKVGVQIGEDFVRVIVEKMEGKRWKRVHEEKENLSEGIVKNGQVLEPEKLGLILKELFLKKNIRDTSVCVFIEEASFFIRHIDLPLMNKKEVGRAIRYRAKMELPVNNSELVIRYYPYIQETTGDEPKNEFVIVALDEMLINRIAQAFHYAGLTLSVLSLEPIALYNGLLLYPDLVNQLKEELLLVRTDTKRMMLSIFSRGKMVHSRYLPFSTGKDDWEQEITRTLMSWNSMEGHERVEQVVVYGEKEHFETIKAHVEGMVPLSILHVSSPLLPCEGIALRKPAELNFYTERITYNLLKKTPLYVYVLVIITGFMLISLLYQFGSQAFVRAQISRLKNNLSQHTEINTLLQKQKELKSAHTNAQKMVDEIKNQNVDPLATYQLISPVTPGSVTFKQIVFDNQSIKVSGTTKDQQTLIAYYHSLQNNTKLSQVILNKATSVTEGLQFIIDMKRNGGVKK